LYHYEEETRGRVDESKEELKVKFRFREKHKKQIKKGDPYYNPNLSLIVPYEF